MKLFALKKSLHGLTSVCLGTLASLTLTLPTNAAEKIYFVYDSLIVSIPVRSLEIYANEGRLTQQLRQYFNLAGTSEEERQAFREALSTPVEVNPVDLSRLLNTDEGERILNYVGKVFNIQGGRNGKYLIRGALVQAAFNPAGLSLINFLNRLATDVQIDVKKAIELSREIELIVQGTYLFTEEVQKLAEIEAKQDPKVDYSQLTDPRQPGPFAVENYRWNLVDRNRDRAFYVEMYQPQTLADESVPVVVISHGLASRPEDFGKWARHLASYGYVVAVPQHPGSDIQQTKAFLEGLSRQIFIREEFIDRPLDISYTIDELERRNEGWFSGKLDLNNVGVMGHSFGGYTVLAVAGATPDFERLKQMCDLEIGDLNTALLLQCRALKLERKDYNFKDERVTALFVVNPVNSGLFGSKSLAKIDIPVFISAGSYDPATPFIFEQAVSFPRLEVPDKYLQLQEGQAHVDFSQLDAGIIDTLQKTTKLTLPSPQLLDDYTNSMMLSFFEVYIENNPQYRPFLQPAYGEYLSQGQEFKTYIITEESSLKLGREIEQFIRQNNITIPSEN
ncbi:alpha/beta hydrolase [Cyanothece sp. BG0011]|uniref:alpha/beta hydrolase n=1 Tax=Cyanothece sp. BG0011 TaxID=2082950 RepID=UPI000D1D9F4C|nr:alpha/beta hydrolase [Cyanothece sp. BG0011]